MSILSERLRGLRKEKGVSQAEVAKYIGMSKSSVNMHERGERKPEVETLWAYADYFDVDTDYLIGKTDVKNQYQYAMKYAMNNINIPATKDVIPACGGSTIPLVGTIACGTPILAVENVEERVDLPGHIHADFALRCKGDSMIGAGIQEGDIVYIRQQDEVMNGQIAAVLVEDEPTLRHIYYDDNGGVVNLVPANPAMPPQVYYGETLNQIRILGLVVGLTRSIKQ